MGPLTAHRFFPRMVPSVGNVLTRGETHPVAGDDLPTVVHQGGGVQLLSRLVEADAVPHVHRRHHPFLTPVREKPKLSQMYNYTDKPGSIPGGWGGSWNIVGAIDLKIERNIIERALPGWVYPRVSRDRQHGDRAHLTRRSCSWKRLARFIRSIRKASYSLSDSSSVYAQRSTAKASSGLASVDPPRE